jgi:hypothetical protein
MIFHCEVYMSHFFASNTGIGCDIQECCYKASVNSVNLIEKSEGLFQPTN